MLSEGEPGDADASARPEPLVRTVFRRFLSGRAWPGPVWPSALG